MNNLSWIQMLIWALVAFFALGFAINTFAVKMVGSDYQRWGYPDWFHFVSGGLELLVALLLLTAATRWPGIALGCAIMLAAIATVLWHHEYHRAVPPLLILVLLLVVGWMQL